MRRALPMFQHAILLQRGFLRSGQHNDRGSSFFSLRESLFLFQRVERRDIPVFCYFPIKKHDVSPIAHTQIKINSPALANALFQRGPIHQSLGRGSFQQSFSCTPPQPAPNTDGSSVSNINERKDLLTYLVRFIEALEVARRVVEACEYFEAIDHNCFFPVRFGKTRG